MSEQEQQLAAQLARIQGQLDEMMSRLARVEGRLEEEARWASPSSAPKGSPSTTPPAEASAPIERPGAHPVPPRRAARPPSEPSWAAHLWNVREAKPKPAAPPPPDEPSSGSGKRERPAGKAKEVGEATEWESLIGGKWSLWVGSIAIFLALAFFLAYAWQYLGPAGRFGVGILAGTAFLAAGVMAREPVERWFGEGLMGAGLALLYLSLWAGTQRYGLLTFELAFACMALNTALGVALALRYDAISLSALATLGGFLTPAVLQAGGAGGGAGAVPFLTYISILNAGILAASLYKRWHGVTWLSFLSTLLLVGGWSLTADLTFQRWLIFVYVSLNFLLFLGAACFYSLARGEETQDRDLLLLSFDALVYTLAGYGLLYSALGDFPGTFPLALALLFALLNRATKALAPDNRSLLRASTGLSVLFITIAVPTQLRLGWITVAWSVEAAVLVTLGLQMGSRLLQRAGQVVWGLSLWSLLSVLAEQAAEPPVLLLNARALPLLVSALATGWMAVAAERLGAEPTGDARNGTAGRDDLAGAYGFYAVAAGAWLIAQETYLYLHWLRGSGASEMGSTPAPEGLVYPGGMGGSGSWDTRALYSIAALWGLYALATYAVGSRLRLLGARLGAFTVAMLAAVLPLWVSVVLPDPSLAPFWNVRWLSDLVVTLSLATMAWLVFADRERLQPSEAEALGFLPALASLVLLAGISFEIYRSCQWWAVPSPGDWEPAALFLLVVFWSLYALGLLALGSSWGQPGLRGLGFAVGGTALLLLLNTAMGWELGWLPILNLRLLAFLVVALSLAVGSGLLLQEGAAGSAGAARAAGTARMLGLAALGVLLWAFTQETYEAFRFYGDSFGSHWDRAAQMGISLVWTLFGVLLLLAGIWRDHQPVRLAALGLLGATVLKVFLFDLSFLDTPYRMLSFGGLGLALIGISWLYSRYGIGHQRPTGLAG